MANDNDFHVSPMEFSQIINSNGYCGDNEVLKWTLKIYNCGNIFLLNPSVYSLKIKHLILRENQIKSLAKGDFIVLVTVDNMEIIRNNVSQMNENAFERLKHLTSENSWA